MSEKEAGLFRIPKTRPHDEEEDFDFRSVIHEDEDLSDVYVIYEDESLNPDIVDKITKLGFKFNGEFWESHEQVLGDDILDLQYDGIIVERI